MMRSQVRPLFGQVTITQSALRSFFSSWRPRSQRLTAACFSTGKKDRANRMMRRLSLFM